MSKESTAAKAQTVPVEMPDEEKPEEMKPEEMKPEEMKNASLTAVEGNGAPQRSFGEILEMLRSKEDSFYFVQDNGTSTGNCIMIDRGEMLLGWDESRQDLAFDPAAILIPLIVVKKDWTGVAVEPQDGRSVKLNGQPVNSSARLRQGDRLELDSVGLDPDGKDNPGRQERTSTNLTFHEPASLVVLDALLPQKLPPPVLRTDPAVGETSELQTSGARNLPARTPATLFSVFTIYDLLLMAVGTLLLAVIIFLVLDNT